MRQLNESSYKILKEIVFEILVENKSTTKTVFVVKVQHRGETRLIKPDGNDFTTYNAHIDSNISDVIFFKRAEAEKAAIAYNKKFDRGATVYSAVVEVTPTYWLKKINSK